MNKDIEEYLDYYCELENPSYAVLLKGQWGCGKSHFISEYKRNKIDKKFIYISLYGLENISQIDDALFQAINPKLGSKGMGIASKIVANSLKSVAKVDLSSGSNYLKKLLSKTENSILIFDDLERCDISVQQIFGYINPFVEYEGRHVLIIGDVEKIDNRKYLEIKEKLIGQELEIQLNIEEALQTFCKSVSDDSCKTFLINSSFDIRMTYALSQLKNLRTLKKAIHEFERIYTDLPPKALGEDDLLRDVLQILLVLSLEVRCGRIQSNNIKELFNVGLSLRNLENSDYVLLDIRKKYQLPYKPILGEDFWQNFFMTGIIDKEKLDEAVLNSSYFQDENTPDWMKLWHALDATDEEFESRKEIVLESLSKQVYKEEPVILHVFGLFLWMSKKGISKDSPEWVLQKFRGYVDKLVEEKSLTFLKGGDNFDSEEHFSLGYFGREEKEFQEFVNYLNQKKQEVVEESFPIQAEELMNIMESDTRLFEQMLVLSNSEVQKYFSIPILKYIKPIRFMDALDKSKDQRTVVSAFERRYEFSEYNKNLLDELPWLEDVKVCLEREVIDREGKISGWRYKRLIKVIDTAIDKLRVIQAGDSVA